MAHRYAVLTDLHGGATCPVGLVVEQDDYVLVEADDALCLPSRYDKPFTVAGPDMTTVAYGPGHPSYFDQVLIDLSRGFAIEQHSTVERATAATVLHLLSTLVIAPIRRKKTAEYHARASRYPVIRQYRQKHYAETAPTGASDDPDDFVTASQGSPVAA